MKVWLTWSELTGGPRLQLDEFRDALRQFPRSALLIACARLSILFEFGPDAKTVASKETTAKFAPEMFPPELVPRVMMAMTQGHPIFFQGQLRYLAAEALRLDPAHDEDGTYIPAIVLGGLLLGAGELLYKPHILLTDNLDVMANLVADFLPLYEIDSMTDGFMLFLRFYIFLTVIIPRLPGHLVTFDVWELFKREFGFPLSLYYQFVYAFTIHAMLERNNRPVNAPPLDGGLPFSWFQKTVLTRDQVSAMFDTVCCELNELPEKKKAHGYADFEYLRDHPYFRAGDTLYSLDYEFAVAKLESGALWRVAKSLPRGERLSYFGFWGSVFEEYVSWLFETYADKNHNTFYTSPKYKRDKGDCPICDAIVICGSTAVLIEAKLGTCAAEVRYSGDYQKFREFLEDKLVSGTDRPIGVAQLLKAIENITTLPADSLPGWLGGVKNIIPLIITKDDIGSSWMTNAYLNARFKQGLNPEKCRKERLTPLVSMSASTLERTMAAIGKMPFSDILEDRIKEDPLLGRPFEAACSYVSRGLPGSVFKHVEIMKELAEEMQTDFGMVDE
jgi:hypothetical protein